jgi:hypothetical protein
MLCLRQSSIGASAVSADIAWVLLMAGSIGSIYLAGRIAERRGRSFKSWAGIAALIGPFALPLVYLFPNLHRNNGNHAN